MVMMNYAYMDEHLKYYLKQFSNYGSSFILKPEHLRWKDIVIKAPTKQDRKVRLGAQTTINLLSESAVGKTNATI